MLQRIVRRLAREARPIRFLTSRALWHTGASPWFAVRRTGGVPGGYRVRFFPSSASSYAWMYPDDVNQEEAFVARTLRPDDTCVDVGANVGRLALRAASVVGAAGQVVAIEAHPRTAAFLRANVAMNSFGHVGVESCAVGEAGFRLRRLGETAESRTASRPRVRRTWSRSARGSRPVWTRKRVLSRVHPPFLCPGSVLEGRTMDAGPLFETAGPGRPAAARA